MYAFLFFPLRLAFLFFSSLSIFFVSCQSHSQYKITKAAEGGEKKRNCCSFSNICISSSSFVLLLKAEFGPMVKARPTRLAKWRAYLHTLPLSLTQPLATHSHPRTHQTTQQQNPPEATYGLGYIQLWISLFAQKSINEFCVSMSPGVKTSHHNTCIVCTV